MRQAVRTQEDDRDLQKAKQSVAAERFQEAIDLLRSIVGRVPDRVDAWYELGEAYRELAFRSAPDDGAGDQALDCYGRVLAVQPQHAPAVRGKAFVYRHRKELALAFECAQDAVRIDPELAVAWRTLGAVHRDRNELDDGLRCYRRALSMEPRDPLLWMNIGNVCRDLGQFDEALRHYDRALEIRPHLLAVRHERARILDRLGKVRDAIGAYRDCIRLAGSEDSPTVAAAEARLRELQSVDGRDEQVVEGSEEPRVSLRPTPRKGDSRFNPGDRIGGRYEVREVIRGGMGAVCVVCDEKSRDVLALKTFQHPPHEQHDLLRRLERSFEKEALAWIALDRHPYIVRAHWVQKLDGRLFIGMDYIAAEQGRSNTLQGRLQNGPLPLNQTLEWGIEFCHGMEYARTKGLFCHRDIKPSNILISSDGHVKIADFGLAAGLDRETTNSVSASEPSGDLGLTMLRVSGQAGTPGYMAPEILKGEGADPRSDVYAFGVVLYQMVTGMSHLPLVKSNGHYDLGHIAPAASPLSPVIERCLQTNARSRYAEFDALRHELQALLSLEAGAVPAPPKLLELEGFELHNKGASLATLGLNQDALASYQRALELDSTDVQSWSSHGNALLSLGRHEEALASYGRALELDSTHVHAWNGRGNALHDLGRHEEALASFTRTLEINPTSTFAWNGHGNALGDLGRHEEALVSYTRALEISPTHTIAWNGRGNALRALGRHEEALASYARAVDLDPTFTAAWYNRGNVFGDLGRHEEALAGFTRALEINLTYTFAWYGRGNALGDLGRHEEAMASYAQAVELDPTFAAAWHGRGKALGDLGRHQEALASYARALEINPTYTFAWHGRGNALGDLGCHEEAMASHARAVDLDPTFAAAWNGRGKALGDLGRYQEALASYARALEINPTDTSAWNGRGIALRAFGRHEEALASFARALELNLTYAEAWSNRGTVLSELDRNAEATHAYREFIQCAPAGYEKQIEWALQRVAELESQ